MKIRTATPADVPAIAALVADYAGRGEVLPRSAAAIQETLDDWIVGENGCGLVACGSLLHYSANLAEVRSVAVADKARRQGWGSAVVGALIERAHTLKIPTLFALTRAVPFFQRMGFSLSHKGRFPEKIWRDCELCPIKDQCDETAVVLCLAAAKDGQSDRLTTIKGSLTCQLTK